MSKVYLMSKKIINVALFTFSIALFASSILFTGCSIDRAPLTPRKYVADLNKNTVELQKLADSMPEYTSPIFNTEGPSACTTLEKLSLEVQSQKNNSSRFSFFKSFKLNNGQLWGAIDIIESPLTQLAITEQVVVPTNEQFLKLVEEEHKAGRLSALKYAFVQSARLNETILTKVKFSAINDKVLTPFPGIYGKATDVSQSLNMLLAKKMGFKNPSEELLSTLSTSLQLLPTDSFSTLRQDVAMSLASAIRSLTTTDIKEKMCSLVLWQRLFAQMLKLKGYRRPEITLVDASAPATYISSHLVELNSEHAHFAVTHELGAFYDVHSKQQVQLSLQDLQSYDLLKRKLIPTLSPYQSLPQEASPKLSETLALLETLIYVFDATSPVQTLNPKVPTLLGKLFGEITDQNNMAVIPREIHSLTLGMINLLFQNLKTDNIVLVSKNGTRLTSENKKNDEKASGALLLEAASGSNENRMHLEDVLTLIRIATRLEANLNQLATHDADFWLKINPVYQPAVYDSLQKVLLVNLKELLLPLTLNALKMAEASDGSCYDTMAWDERTGQLSPLTQLLPQSSALTQPIQCSAELLTDYKNTLLELSIAKKSPILYRRFR